MVREMVASYERLDQEVNPDSRDPLIEQGKNQKFTSVYVFGSEKKILDDSSDATMVLIMPHIVSDKLGEPSKAEVNGREMAERIFVHHDEMNTDKEFYGNRVDPYTDNMTFEQFVFQARQDVLSELEINKYLKSTAFRSIDDDMLFIKVDFVDEQTQTRSQTKNMLCAKFEYSLPFHEESYERDYPELLGLSDEEMKKMNLNEKGNKKEDTWIKMPQVDGRPYPAHHTFTEPLDKSLAEPSDIDSIRFVMQELSSIFNVPGMLDLGIFTKYFPAQKSEVLYGSEKPGPEGPKGLDMLKHEYSCPCLKWLPKVQLFPTREECHDIRTYFGEEVAFFFNFHQFYVSMLLKLFVFAFFVAVLQTSTDHGVTIFGCTIKNPLTFTQQNYLKVALGGVMVIWAVLFKQLFTYQMKSNSHRWGMDQNSHIEIYQLKAYWLKEHNTPSAWLLNKGGDRNILRRINNCMLQCMDAIPVLASVIQFVYIIAFVVAILKIAALVKEVKYRVYAFTAATFIFSWVWGSKIAPILTWLQTYKEGGILRSRYNNTLARNLTIMKLVLFLFPLYNLAFLAPISRRICYSDLDTAAEKYFDSEIAGNVPKAAFSVLGEDVSPKNKLYLDYVNHLKISPTGGISKVVNVLSEVGMMVPLEEDKVCLKGCPPIDCDIYHDSDGEPVLSCLTSCYSEMQKQLYTLFFTHILCSVIFTLIGALSSNWAMWQEVAMAEENGKMAMATEPNCVERMLKCLKKCLPCAKTKEKSKEEAPEKKYLEGTKQADGYSLLQYQEKQYDCAPYDYLSWGGSYVEDFLEVVLNFAVLTCFGIVNPILAILGFFLPNPRKPCTDLKDDLRHMPTLSVHF
jgi:hypothetical protein